MSKDQIVWYAAGGGIKKTGPFDSQVKAWKAMVLAPAHQEKYGSIHPIDTRVWPESRGMTGTE